jgi:hypothetical protein
MNTTSAHPMIGPIRIPSLGEIKILALGGLVGLVIWEFWARVITKFVVGDPLEPAGLIDAIANHQFGLMVPYVLREALHYGVGIFGYPIAYFLISRNLKNWGLVLDVVVLVTFTIAVLGVMIKGLAGATMLVFWAGVALLIALRYFWRNNGVVDAITWGNFTWFNALGLMAPLGGLSFYALGDSVGLSFMSFVGHVIYGALAVLVFERRQAKA